MAEFEELIPELRKILISTEDAGFLETFKGNITTAAESIEGVLKTSLEDISTKVEFIEGRGFMVNDLDVVSELETVLKTGDITPLFEMAGTDLENIEVQNSIRTFKRVSADLPERRLTDLAAEQRIETIPIESEAGNLDRITANPNDIVTNDKILSESPKTSSLKEWFKRVVKTVTVITVGGIVVYLGLSLAEYMKNYIQAKSGAFEVSTVDGKITERKIVKYSCGFPGGDIEHPFDKEITAYLKSKDPCLDVAKYDNCAGWATIGKGSRLAVAKIEVSKLGRNRTLICRKATAMDAIAALAKKVGNDLKEIVKDISSGLLDGIADILRPFAPLIAVAGTLATGGISFLLLAKQRMVIRLFASLLVGVIIGVILYLIIMHLRTNPIKAQSPAYYTLIPVHFTKIHDGIYVF